MCCAILSAVTPSPLVNFLQYRASCEKVDHMRYKDVSMRLLAEVVVRAIHQHQVTFGNPLMEGQGVLKWYLHGEHMFNVGHFIKVT